jgi:hypothetical protein
VPHPGTSRASTHQACVEPRSTSRNVEAAHAVDVGGAQDGTWPDSSTPGSRDSDPEARARPDGVAALISRRGSVLPGPESRSHPRVRAGPLAADEYRAGAAQRRAAKKLRRAAPPHARAPAHPPPTREAVVVKRGSGRRRSSARCPADDPPLGSGVPSRRSARARRPEPRSLRHRAHRRTAFRAVHRRARLSRMRHVPSRAAALAAAGDDPRRASRSGILGAARPALADRGPRPRPPTDDDPRRTRGERESRSVPRCRRLPFLNGRRTTRDRPTPRSTPSALREGCSRADARSQPSGRGEAPARSHPQHRSRRANRAGPPTSSLVVPFAPCVRMASELSCRGCLSTPAPYAARRSRLASSRSRLRAPGRAAQSCPPRVARSPASPQRDLPPGRSQGRPVVASARAAGLARPVAGAPSVRGPARAPCAWVIARARVHSVMVCSERSGACAGVPRRDACLDPTSRIYLAPSRAGRTYPATHSQVYGARSCLRAAPWLVRCSGTSHRGRTGRARRSARRIGTTLIPGGLGPGEQGWA